jgi:hypothetical protein
VQPVGIGHAVLTIATAFGINDCMVDVEAGKDLQPKAVVFDSCTPAVSDRRVIGPRRQAGSMKEADASAQYSRNIQPTAAAR